MENKPNMLNEKINIDKEYIIGKVIKNQNISNKKEYIQILDKENINLYEEGYKAYIFEKLPKNIHVKNYCENIKQIDNFSNYDVIEIVKNGKIRILYRDSSDDNFIVVTNQCNSNCIMCPDADSVRKSKIVPNINVLIDTIRALPSDVKHITITGGEPGLLKENLIRLIGECKINLSNTEFLLLSNGRIFSNTEFVNEFKAVAPPKIRVGIPIYADNSTLHDEITRVENSFKQAICGIKKLLSKNIDVEVRIVVQKKNYQILDKIAKYIAAEIPNVTMVNIMSLEMCGNAILNKKDVWVDYEDTKEFVYKACYELIKNGIKVNLYNFPLCMLDERVYAFAMKSISDYKIKYKEECNECVLKEHCGGFFNTTINMKGINVKPIK